MNVSLIIADNEKRIFEDVTPVLTAADVELLRAMGAVVKADARWEKPEDIERVDTVYLTFKEELPKEALFLLESRLEGKPTSEVIRVLTDAKEAEEKESLDASSLSESPEAGEKGSPHDSRPVNEDSAE